jgi:transcriptional regulator of met regulon
MNLEELIMEEHNQFWSKYKSEVKKSDRLKRITLLISWIVIAILFLLISR